MIAADENALICDLAETYGIYDYKQLPPSRVAVFSIGLKDDSRIKMKISGQTVSMEVLLLAGISDRLSLLVWAQTEDGRKGINRPAMITDALTTASQPKDAQMVVFDSGEEFISMRNKLLGGD